MPNITMEDFIDECLTGKKPKREKRKVIEEKPTDVSAIFEADDGESVVNDKDSKKSKEKEDDNIPEVEKTKEEDTVISFVLHINDDKKVKKYSKEEFQDDIPLNFLSILKQFNLDMDQIAQKAEAPTEVGEAPDVPGVQPVDVDSGPKYNKFRLSIREFITSGAGNESVELSWRREGEGESAIETAEVVTSNGSMPFNDSPDPLNAAVTTFDRIYYNDILSKIREELEWEETSE